MTQPEPLRSVNGRIISCHDCGAEIYLTKEKLDFLGIGENVVVCSESGNYCSWHKDLEKKMADKKMATEEIAISLCSTHHMTGVDGSLCAQCERIKYALDTERQRAEEAEKKVEQLQFRVNLLSVNADRIREAYDKGLNKELQDAVETLQAEVNSWKEIYLEDEQNIKELQAKLFTAQSKIEELEKERAIWESTRNINIDLCRQIMELGALVGEKDKALKSIVEDNLHPIEPGGGCVKGCEYNSSDIPCIIGTAEIALSLTPKDIRSQLEEMVTIRESDLTAYKTKCDEIAAQKQTILRMRELIDGCYPFLECWAVISSAQRDWKIRWLKEAKEALKETP